MSRVEVGRYDDPDVIGFKGWVGSDDWILFEKNDGSILLFRREEEKVVGDPVILD